MKRGRKPNLAKEKPKPKHESISEESSEEEVEPPTKKKKETALVYPDLSQIRGGLTQKDNKFGFKKGIGYFSTSKVSEIKWKLDEKDNAIVSGKVKGSEKTPYEVDIVVPQNPASVHKWKGTCQCDNSANKGNVCSHQIALLLELEDQQRLKSGEIKESDKVRLKKESGKKAVPAAEKKIISAARQELGDQTNATLKAMLKYNDCMVTGNKEDLLTRISEAMVNGVIPRCESCGGGRPKWMEGYWMCEGYLDDVTWSNCSFVARKLTRPKWKIEA